ncbi:MAG: hypothetical protein V3S64_12965, partial [bacterium]
MNKKSVKSTTTTPKNGVSRRKILKTAAQAATVGAVASGFPYSFNIVHGAESIRTIGLGVSII